MEIIVIVLLAIGLLYAWLVAHWFARVLVFLCLWPLLMCCIYGGLCYTFVPRVPWGHPAPPGESVCVLFGFMLGGIVAWYVSLIPTFYRRHMHAESV